MWFSGLVETEMNLFQEGISVSRIYKKLNSLATTEVRLVDRLQFDKYKALAWEGKQPNSRGLRFYNWTTVYKFYYWFKR
jgi:hypothetical protein